MPYQTSTTTLIATLAEATVAAPSATPQVYVVVAGDTLFAIAARYAITVEALRAANPGVDPLLLSPGDELVIPVAGAGLVSPLPSPTPVAAQLGAVDCYSSALGELWCFFPVHNDNEEPLENLIGTVLLLSEDGDVLASLEAVPSLNVLPPGQTMPLVAYTSEQPLDWVAASGLLLSAYSLASENDYYLDVDLLEVDIEISDTGKMARATGQARAAGEQQPGRLWVLAVAYAVDGKVVGMRRWESAGETEFNFWVFSLGPEIVEVELLVEARP
jgi:LysM repeat protein